MSISSKVQQISLPLEFPVSPIYHLPEKELLALCKNGNGEAIEILYERYTPLLYGPFTRGILNYNTNGSTKEDNEDARSIIKVIFMEAILGYTEGRSTFSTYLVNRIKWKFRDKLFSERIIAVRNNRSAAEMKRLLDATQCALVDITKDNSLDKSISAPSVAIMMNKEEFVMPLTSFIDGMFMDACMKTLSKKERTIYFFYMETALKEMRGATNKVAKKFNMSPGNATKYIQKCSMKVANMLNIQGIRFL